MDIKRKAYIFLITAIVLSALTPVLLSIAKGVNIYELFFLTYLISAPLSLLLALGKKKRNSVSALLKNKRRLVYLVAAILLLFVPFYYGIAYAEHTVSASLTAVIFRLNPLLMLFFIPIILSERLSRYQIAALALAAVGIVIGISGGNPLNILSQGATLPILLFLVAVALLYALGNVIIKKYNFDTDVLLALSGIVMLAFSTLLFIAAGAPLAPLSPVNTLIVLYMAAVVLGAFYMYFNAIKILKITLVANAFSITPFITFIWAAIIIGEPIEVYYILIALLSVAGVMVQRYDKRGGSYAPDKAKEHLKHFTLFDVTGVFDNAQGSEIGNIISDGGRVMATKVHRSHAYHVDAVTGESGYKNVYTESSGAITKEASFIRDITKAGESEAIVVKAGPVEENENFFNELGSRINPQTPSEVPKNIQ